MNSGRIWNLIGVLILLLICIGMVGCSGSTVEKETPITKETPIAEKESTPSECVTPLPLTTYPPSPDYIHMVSPVRKSKEDYDRSKSSIYWMVRGVAVSIWANRMDVAEENCDWETISQRSKLYIDGKRVADDTLVGGAEGEPGCNLFRPSWGPDLTPGLHEARFQFTTDSGEVLEYGWQITIEE